MFGSVPYYGKQQHHLVMRCCCRLQVPLSARGWEQAVACGEDIRVLMESEHGSSYKLFFMTSPYCRTRQTFVGVRQAFPDDCFAGVQVRRLKNAAHVWLGALCA
jgi:broad specificity phosphatase PhoE